MDIALSKCLRIVKLVAIKGETLVDTYRFLDIVDGVRRLHTSRVIVFPVEVFTKICMGQSRRRVDFLLTL